MTSLNTLLSSAAGLWVLEPVNKAKTLAEKQAAQEVLAKALIPKDGTLDGLLALLRVTSSLCKLDEAMGQACPLCKRELGFSEVQLFKQYHELLAGELERDIAALKGDIAKAVEFVTAVVNVDRKAWDKYTTIQAEVLTTAKSGSDLVVARCDVSKEPTAEAKAALESLKTAAAAWAAQLEAKKNAIAAATKGREELVKQLAKLRGEIEPLEYAQAIAERLERTLKAC